MRLLKDYRGKIVRLTDERVRHFAGRIRRAGMFDFLDETVEEPDFIIQSSTDQSALINYRRYPDSKIGDKYLCVVVKYDLDDAYVLTAYPSDEIKKGILLWEQNRK